jgi:hypothetical protein
MLFSETQIDITVIGFFVSVVDTGDNLVSCVVDNSNIPAAFSKVTCVMVTGIKLITGTSICEHRAIICYYKNGFLGYVTNLYHLGNTKQCGNAKPFCRKC